MKLKILSYNIHKGFDWKNQNYFLHEMKDFIRSSHADIVFLQEVVGKNEKYKDRGLIDQQFEFLAEEIWPHFSYGHNAVYDHGHHGNLILSKFPIETFENIDLSTNKWERRGMLLAKIQLPEEKSTIPFFYAACSHLNLLHGGRLLQYEMIKEEVMNRIDNDTPFIIAGDFNDWNKKCADVFEGELQMHEVHKSIHGKFAKTFPAGFPLLSLDRIYVRNAHVKKVKVLGPSQQDSMFKHLSDHLPLYCEVDLYGP
jgi:endonuclease/exonuclease/phosphatase family metal-dependent hydrolase